MDPNEPHWQMNSSFSPPLARRWDIRFQAEGSSHGSRGTPTCGSSSSLHSKGSRSRLSDDQYPNHHHSVSDGAVSYFGSPSDNFKAPLWTPPLRRFDLGEFATPSGGARPEASVFSQSSERCFAAGASSISNSIGSGSPLSESGRWGTVSKGPLLFPPRHSFSRRSFMSKPIYPLVLCNPVSESGACELPGTSGGGSLTPIGNNKTSPTWHESDSSPELKFHKTLTDLQKMEASPGPETSSRRQGFRWSNASSYDFGFEEDIIDISESISLENRRSLSSVDQKCGLCRRLLCQKSPWSSHRIVRNSDMPIAGVLPCGHVFHVECLEEITPLSQIHEPPCPLCTGSAGINESVPFSEPLQVALRAIHRQQGANDANAKDGDLKRNKSLPMLRRGGSSLIKNHFKKNFLFKGNMAKDMFGAKVLGRNGASSSSMLHTGKRQIGK